MTDHVDSERWNRTDAEGPEPSDGSVSVEAYETDGRTVFFDAENPLAWLETSMTVRLRELV